MVSLRSAERPRTTHEKGTIMHRLRTVFSRPSSLLLLALPVAVACHGPGHHASPMTEAEIDGLRRLAEARTKQGVER